MKVEYSNLYTHFIFTTFLREALILNTNFLISRSPGVDEESLASVVANSSTNFIRKTNFVNATSSGKCHALPFLFRKRRSIMFVNIF